jgi:hypothetical protein
MSALVASKIRRPSSPSIDLRGDDRRITGPDDALCLQPVQGGAHGPLGQVRVADQRPDAGERLLAVRRRMVGEPDQHRLAGRVPLSAAIARHRREIKSPRNRLDAHREFLQEIDAERLCQA